MEIIEIISYKIDNLTDTILVKFRMNEDSLDEVRSDEIDLKESDDFGYVLISEDFGFYEDDEEEVIFEDNVDEEELTTFLNEYYMVYPDRLPKKI